MFRRVKVPEGVRRGGIVTQASILTTTSNGTRTSPVKRGTWVLKTLLGIDPGLPVANVGEIAPKVPGIDKATVRQRLEIHRYIAPVRTLSQQDRSARVRARKLQCRRRMAVAGSVRLQGLDQTKRPANRFVVGHA